MYFITVINPDSNRCVGYYSNLKDAIEVLDTNMCDLWEAGYYPDAVIENIKEGIYQYDEKPLWFSFSIQTNKYERSKQPDYICNNYVGFGIG